MIDHYQIFSVYLLIVLQQNQIWQAKNDQKLRKNSALVLKNRHLVKFFDFFSTVAQYILDENFFLNLPLKF